MLTGGGAEDQTHTHRGTGQKTKTTNMKKNKLTKTNLKELPLRPYPGYILVTRNRKAFVRAAKELFDEDEDLTGKCGRFRMGPSWYHPFTAVVWYSSPETLAHELAHVTHFHQVNGQV